MALKRLLVAPFVRSTIQNFGQRRYKHDGRTAPPRHTAIPEQLACIASPDVRANLLTRADVTVLLLQAKARKQCTFIELSDAIGGGATETFVAAAMYGQQPLTREQATKLVDALGGISLNNDQQQQQTLRDHVINVLQTIPVRGYPNFDTELVNDPTIYRLQEVVKVYGLPIKALIHERFGDGIMSAIDFSLGFEESTGKTGERRVKITLDGKYLQYSSSFDTQKK